jgi:hypothetical protein
MAVAGLTVHTADMVEDSENAAFIDEDSAAADKVIIELHGKRMQEDT